MTERPAETVHGPVDSAITQFLQHLEISMWACDVPPDKALEVINLLMFGSRVPGPHGGTYPVQEWTEAMADRALRTIVQDVTDRAESLGQQPREQDIRIVGLTLIRKILQDVPTTFDQVLAS